MKANGQRTLSLAYLSLYQPVSQSVSLSACLPACLPACRPAVKATPSRQLETREAETSHFKKTQSTQDEMIRNEIISRGVYSKPFDQFDLTQIIPTRPKPNLQVLDMIYTLTPYLSLSTHFFSNEALHHRLR